MSLTFREATEEDFPRIANMRLRRVDREEIQGFYGSDASTGGAIVYGLLQSVERGVVEEDGHGPICAWGIIPEHPGSRNAVVWVLGTKRMYRHKIKLMRYAKRELRKLMKRYDVLCNFISTTNIRTIEWLEWMGFTVEPQKITFADPTIEFYFFHRRKDE